MGEGDQPELRPYPELDPLQLLKIPAPRRMPKHVPTYKHLLTTSQPSSQSEYREQGVNDLIAKSRVQKPVQRDLPPHITRGVRVWAPTTTGINGLPDVDEGGVHP